jgi:hypothetical protein
MKAKTFFLLIIVVISANLEARRFGRAAVISQHGNDNSEYHPDYCQWQHVNHRDGNCGGGACNFNWHNATGRLETMEKFQIIVDYKTTITKDLSKLHSKEVFDGFVETNLLTSRNFKIPACKFGKRDTVICSVVYFGKRMTTEEIVEKLRSAGYRPANAKELIAFVKKCPQMIQSDPIVALGSSVIKREILEKNSNYVQFYRKEEGLVYKMVYPFTWDYKWKLKKLFLIIKNN